MTRRRIAYGLRRTSFAILIAGSSLGLLAPAMPADSADVQPQVIRVAASEATSRFVALGIGKSIAIDLPVDVKDVLVADPKTANAVIRSARRAYIIGVKVGQTNIFFFDANGKQIAGFDIAVTRDLNGLRGALRQSFPDADIRVEGIGDGIMLSGTAASPAEAQQAFDLASRLAGDTAKVVNGITVRDRDQVMLKVTVAEVRRDVLKQLGINFSGSLGYGTTVFNTNNPFSASGSDPTNSLKISGFSPSGNGLSATLQAMNRASVMRTLAEPNLTAVSGETASFVAGGEFPIPTGLSCDTTTSPPVCQPTISFKKFGVSLTFTPVVLSAGRISLKLQTEVSNVSTDNAISLQQAGFSTTVPSIQTRRAETTVELPSGGSLALAGMIQEQTKHAISGTPGLMELPILGTLFRSRDYINDQTELVVIVTPYIVHPVSAKRLSRPDDGFADPTDPSSILLGRLNRIYGSATGDAPAAKSYQGQYGFILE
jgi:pilus assembly protein CpaC